MISVALRKQLGDFALDAAFDAPERGITAIFGASGSGKTSVVNAIAGLIKPDTGTIRIGEETLFDRARSVDVPAEARRIGYVFQDARLFPHMNVRDNLLYGERRARDVATASRYDDIVALLGIAPLLERVPHGLSGGERQRVALGRALLSRPRLLLMDEPLASLDDARKDEVLPYLDRLHSATGTPIIYVSHAAAEVTRLADHLVLMAQGRVMASGPLHELAARLDLWGSLGAAFTGAILDGTVVAHDTERKLTKIETTAGAFQAPAIDAPLGTKLRLRIPARDVVLAKTVPTGLSVQNILKGTLADISDDGRGRTRVRVTVMDAPILAELTTDAVRRLGLTQGNEIYVLIKSVGFERL